MPGDFGLFQLGSLLLFAAGVAYPGGGAPDQGDGRVPRPEGVHEGVQDEEVAHVERVGGRVESRIHRPKARVKRKYVCL